MYIVESQSKAQYDVTELLVKASYTTSLEAQPGRLTFTLKRDPNEILLLSLGSLVDFRCDGEKVFYGNIFKLSTSEGDTYDVLAYDSLRYLQNHDFYFVEGGKKAFMAFFSELCGKCGMGYKIGMGVKPPAAMLSQQLFVDKSYFDMINHYISELNDQSTETRYFLRDNHGKIELGEIGAAYQYGLNGEFAGNPLVIGEQSLLTNYDYSLDIDTDTYNEIICVADSDETNGGKAKGKHIVYATQDKVALARYGLLRKVQTVQKGYNTAQVEAFTDIALQLWKSPTKSMSVKALGFNGMYAGAGFVLNIEKLRVRNKMYIVSATHDYEPGRHTMTLDVEATAMTEVL
jgi:hypothetical protein